MFVQYNANPTAARVGDCTIRAISKVTDQSWEQTYIEVAVQGLIDHDMPSANHVWGDYLERIGFRRRMIPDTCPRCYTVRMFADDHKKGRYILSLAGHVVACIDGDVFDTWNSLDETVLYFWERSK